MAIVPKNYLAKFGLWTNYELQILNQLSIYVWLHTENQIYKSGKKLLFFFIPTRWLKPSKIILI